MCGILGIYSHQPVAQNLHDGLLLLQHRGQDAAGIVVQESGKIYQHKGNGLVRDVFHQRHLNDLKGSMGIAHVRYPTAGTPHQEEAQPLYVNSPYGIAMAHNGNLINSEKLIKELFAHDHRHINTGSDSEILLNIFANELLNQMPLIAGPDAIFKAITKLHRRVRGSYAAVAMISNVGLVAFRDPHAIRPLIYAKKETEQGTEYMFASESVAFNAAGFETIRDLKPGEAIFIDQAGDMYSQVCCKSAMYRSCIFEYVYFARPDSIIDNVFVHKARMRMGDQLAKKIKQQWPDYKIDVVVPVPDTSRTAALELAIKLKVRYREGFIKNRYIGRTFIMPWQKERQKSVRHKLNPLVPEFKGKKVMIVDDSIVRGTTSKQIVQMARDAGAKEVYLVSASPPICYPNIYGIDMPVPGELIAYGRKIDQICSLIGADRLFYQDLDGLIEAVQTGNRHLKEFDCSMFDGDYVVEPEDGYLEQLKLQRSEQSKQNKIHSTDLHVVPI
ncbi:MAG: amidophosphoribosyltransferase [Chromatiales bacterium]|nr:amidophosphoribosyltransferase [Chromatiales bacterium]